MHISNKHEEMHVLLLYFHIHWQFVSPFLDLQNGFSSMVLFAVGVCQNSSMFTLQTAEFLKGYEQTCSEGAEIWIFSHKKLLRLGALLGPSCVSCLQLCGTFFRSVYVSICGGNGRESRLVHSEVHNPVGAQIAHSVHCDQVQCRSSPLNTSHTRSRQSCMDAPFWQYCFWSRNPCLRPWVPTPLPTGPCLPDPCFLSWICVRSTSFWMSAMSLQSNSMPQFRMLWEIGILCHGLDMP